MSPHPLPGLCAAEINPAIFWLEIDRKIKFSKRITEISEHRPCYSQAVTGVSLRLGPVLLPCVRDSVEHLERSIQVIHSLCRLVEFNLNLASTYKCPLVVRCKFKGATIIKKCLALPSAVPQVYGAVVISERLSGISSNAVREKGNPLFIGFVGYPDELQISHRVVRQVAEGSASGSLNASSKRDSASSIWLA